MTKQQATQGQVVEAPQTQQAQVPAQVPQQQPSLLAKIASRYGVEANRMLATLKQTAFKMPAGKAEPSNEQMVALLVVADQFGLNPFTKELFAFPDDRNGVVPVLSVDGWTRLVNSNAEYDGYEVSFSEETVDHGGKKVPSWCQISMYRKDRSRPTTHREWFDEVKRNTAPWGSHPRRMLEHKAFIQTARRCFGFGGLYDQDEAERIVDMGAVQTVQSTEMPKALADLNQRVIESQPSQPAPAVDVPQSDPVTVDAPAQQATNEGGGAS